ncbi:MAG: redoxin domain-containing protein [Thermoleophilia bacterium]|nr:redoxin domain-containing protein [Thermoleophilia bacterium]
MAVVLFASRLVLATVLGVAGVAKLIDRQGTRRALLDFGVPARLARPAALVLPLIELATAAALVPSRSGRWGAVAALGLLSVFSIAVGIALVRGRRPDCHCFGQLHASQAGWRTLIRNLGLMGLAAAIVWVYPTTAAPTTGQALLVLGFAAAALTVAAQAWIWFQLLHQNGRVLSRLEQLEQRQPSTTESATPHIGAPAPAFDLPAVNGGRLGLPGLLARGRPVLLVFGHSSCGPCQALLPQLARWQDDLAEHLTVALVN